MPAGEAPIAGHRPRLIWCSGIRRTAIARCCRCEGPEQLAGIVAELAGRGDYVVCLGAGNITQWAYALPGELKALG